MSNKPESELDLDLHFLPAWAQQSPEEYRSAKYDNETGRDSRPDRRGGDRPGRGPRRDGPRRDSHPRERRPEGRPEGARGRGPRPEFVERKPEPLPEVEVNFAPEDNGVKALASQIKLSGRAYPLFDIAHLILKRSERFHLAFSVVKKADGKVAQPLFECTLDETVWLSEEAAVDHALGKHFELFYQTERTPTDPPKGVYTFVAQCGMSGVILGPPNYHDYQNKLRRLHSERFSRMPFETFKARVKIVRDEAVVKQWLEEQSFKTEYVCLNVPEARKLSSREEVRQHFRETHLPTVIRQVSTFTARTPAARQLLPRPLEALARMKWEEQRRFPLKVATYLSQQFASNGLQFFKVNKTVTHVCVARPHFLDLEATPVSDRVKSIVEFINGNAKCTRRQLLQALAPAPEGGDVPKEKAPDATPEEGATPAPTPEQESVISDLHWLIHQGHVIEFANGILETAKKPNPKPAKPQPSGGGKPAEPQQPAADSGADTVKPPSDEADAGSSADGQPAPEAGDQPTPPADAGGADRGQP